MGHAPTPPHHPPSATQKKIGLPAVILGVLGLVLYFNTTGFDYALDDKAIITHNKVTQKGISGIPILLTTGYWYGLKGENKGAYRPIAPITFAIEQTFFGEKPGISHFINMLLYALTGMLLFITLHRWFCLAAANMHWILSFTITALYLAHPLHTEVVANIKSRDEILAFLFILISLWLSWRNLIRPNWMLLAGSGLCFFLALLSKENAIFLVALVPHLLFYFGKQSLSEVALKSIPHFLAAGLFLVVYFQVTAMVPKEGLHLFDNALTANAPASSLWATKIYILGEYFRLLVKPFPLVYDYSYNQIPLTTFSNWQVWLSLLIILGCIGFAIWTFLKFWKTKKLSFGYNLVSFGILWFFSSLFIVSNIPFLIGSTMAERFLYMPSLGFVMIIGWFIIKISGINYNQPAVFWYKSPVWIIITGGLVIAGSMMTINRNTAWKDEFTLFSTDTPHLQHNAKAHHNLANKYIDQAEASLAENKKQQWYKAAQLELTQAIHIYPDVVEFHDDMGDIKGQLQDFNGAISSYQASIQINPNRALPYAQLGKAQGILQQYDAAITNLSKSLELAPNNLDAMKSLAITYGIQGDYREALTWFEIALQKAPRDPEVLNNLIITCQQLGETQKAQTYQVKLNQLQGK